MDILWRNQTGGGHSMIAFDDGQRTLFIQSNEKHRTIVFRGAGQLIAERTQLGNEGVRRMRTYSGPNVLHHFRQIEIAVGEFAPVIAWEYTYAGQIIGP